MTCTQFDSPHGLQNVENISNAVDMAKLTHIAMQSETFRRIVGTKYYETDIRRIKNLTDKLRGINLEDLQNMSKLSKKEQRKLKEKQEQEIFYD